MGLKNLSMMYTPQKCNIDTKNGHLKRRNHYFQSPSCWVSSRRFFKRFQGLLQGVWKKVFWRGRVGSDGGNKDSVQRPAFFFKIDTSKPAVIRDGQLIRVTSIVFTISTVS